MYIISQFSKLTGLTVKALRYYDEEGIVTPSFRNSENQYRFYTDEDVKKASLIKLLRSFNFTIMEIKDVLNNVDSIDDVQVILQEKINMIEENMMKQKQLIEQINEAKSKLVSNNVINDYQIDVVEIEELEVASIRFKGKYSELDKYVPILYQAVKNNGIGKHFNCYYDEEYTETADIELCIPIRKKVNDLRITCHSLPRIQALRTIHYGSYETLNIAYQALFRYVNEEHLQCLIPSREIYRKSPGMIFKGNPNNYVTEILLPIEGLRGSKE